MTTIVKRHAGNSQEGQVKQRGTVASLLSASGASDQPSAFVAEIAPARSDLGPA